MTTEILLTPGILGISILLFVSEKLRFDDRGDVECSRNCIGGTDCH
jgi:hypothetical protein